MPIGRRKPFLIRYGIGEWFGEIYENLTPERRRELAEIKTKGLKERKQPCPFFAGTVRKPFFCNKKDGVCTFIAYHHDTTTDTFTRVSGDTLPMDTMCPYRFYQSNTVFRTIAECLLCCATPEVIGQVKFLIPEVGGNLAVIADKADAEVEAKETAADATTAMEADVAQTNEQESVGNIDHILIVPDSSPLQWCALEIQAVYFSGQEMGMEFSALREHGYDLKYPVGKRHPDYRSSGPKRLMPQLQTKVPSIRRWGKKMAVLIDERFFQSLGKMLPVKDSEISNSEIAWFIVRYIERNGKACLEVYERPFLTTLDDAVKGLTAGRPVGLDTFENRIREKWEKTKKENTPPQQRGKSAEQAEDPDNK